MCCNSILWLAFIVFAMSHKSRKDTLGSRKTKQKGELNV